MKRLMVKPTPHSAETPTSWRHRVPSGSLARPSRISAALAPQTPTSLPTKRPKAMPSGSGSASRRLSTYLSRHFMRTALVLLAACGAI
jgi:uncharacterized membrane protein YccC